MEKNKTLIMMSTYNGERYLPELLESIILQSSKCDLIVRDDGSTDNTLSVLKEYSSKINIKIIKGENKGARLSFYLLMEDVCNNFMEYDYYAFCDQDDVWKSNKINVAINKIILSKEQPTLYIGSWTYVDSNLNYLSDHITNRAFTFNEILVKNHIIGCCMVFNNALLKIYATGIENLTYKNLPFHDHWLYILCLACGGNVVADNKSHLLYRQHNNNVVGKRNNLTKIKQIFNSNHIRYLYIDELKRNYYYFLLDDYKKQINIILNYNKNINTKLTAFFLNRLSPPIYSKKLLSNLSFCLTNFDK